MARAERAWDRFTDEIVAEDDYLIRLAEVLIIGYSGSMNFLVSVQKWYKKYGEITPAQARAVLNIYMTDRNYAMPLMMALNFGVESPSNHILTVGSIRAFAQTMVKKASIEQTTLKNAFTNISMAEVKELPEADTEGRIFPKSWKVNVQRKRTALSDAKQSHAAHRGVPNIHAIHTDSWIKEGSYYIVTMCSLYRATVPDPFGLFVFSEEEVNCSKCLDRMAPPEPVRKSKESV